MELSNMMEPLVWQRIDSIIAAHEGACACEKCRLDVAALALNMLRPQYVVTTRGAAYAKSRSLDQQFSVDIVTALSNAVRQVNACPHHGRTDA